MRKRTRRHSGAQRDNVSTFARFMHSLLVTSPQERALSSDAIRVGIVGAGNCASSFVQGLHYYRDADPAQTIPGLMHARVGRYHVSDIHISAAFDVNASKV